ncbi:DUF3870 domain-containing protein [Lipingzhangella sp. LS1_29]|uniref:DUF3870 domain-containing protein n=1 Tax=Lipingzhangella rawalii TaxID=2055835 RepID=A0ABU2H2C6_9ACTN|nr:DUF3870 domain-containing protein [Lipingzhangella rawalii]MDS1269455.1 DUF3870 domain-containing protein [Lipingzhangella rawalii]
MPVDVEGRYTVTPDSPSSRYSQPRDVLADPDVRLVSGYARLPDAVASHSQYERLGVVLAVRGTTGEIVAADTTLLTDLAKEFFRVLVEGLSVYEDVSEIVQRVQTRYAGQSGGALATALRRCLESCYQLRTADEPNHTAGEADERRP